MNPLILFINPIEAIGHALGLAFAMFWEILWALLLSFTLSVIVQAVVSKSEMSRLLPNDSPKVIAIACSLGAASSSEGQTAISHPSTTIVNEQLKLSVIRC